MQFPRFARIIALALLASVLVVPGLTTAQEEPTGPEITLIEPQAPNDARIRFVHAFPPPSGSPPGLPVDIYLGDTRVAASVPYTTISDYADIAPGSVNIRVFAAGALPTTTPLVQAPLTALANTLYTCVVHPTAPPAAVAPTATCVTDSLSGLAPGNARLDVFHFSRVVQELAPAVDVRLADNTVLINDLSFTNAEFVDVPAGTYDLKLTDATGAVTLLTFNRVQVTAGAAYSLFAIGNPTEVGVPNTVVPTAAQVRVVHAAIGAPNVDVYVDAGTTPVLTNIPFFTASEYLSVPSGSRSFRITQTGQTATLLQVGPINLEPGKAYTAVARGDAANVTTLGITLFFDNLSSPASGNTRVRAYHLSPNAPSVRLALNGTGVAGTTVSYLQATPYLEIPSGIGTFQAIVADGPSSGVVALTLPNVQTFGEQVVDVFVIDLNTRLRAEVRVTDTDSAFRLVHAAPAVGNVDVYVGESTASAYLRAVPFGTIGSYNFEEPGLYRVRVFPAGANAATTTPAIDTYVTLEPGKKYTIAARNSGAAAPASPVRAVVFTDNQSSPSPGNARVRVYHLSPTINALTPGGVDVNVVGIGNLINDLQLDQASASVQVPVGSYTAQVTNASGSVVIVQALPVVASGRYTYDLFAIDRPAPDQPTIISRESFPLDIPVYNVSLPTISQ